MTLFGVDSHRSRIAKVHYVFKILQIKGEKPTQLENRGGYCNQKKNRGGYKND